MEKPDQVKDQYAQGEDEATIGFGRVIRHVASNAGAFGGWGPKTQL